MSNPSVNSPDPPQPRRYHSPRRAEAAEQTRARILASAHELFLERGFAGTTTKAIAAGAGVVEKTVFLVFPSKAALLSEVIRDALRPDDAATPVANGARWQAMLAAPTDQLLVAFGELTAEMLSRAARILAVGEAAAQSDPELTARRQLGHASNRAWAGTVVDALAARGQLEAEPQQATDILFALSSEAVYLRFVDTCGWTDPQYAAWLTGALRELAGVSAPVD